MERTFIKKRSRIFLLAGVLVLAMACLPGIQALAATTTGDTEVTVELTGGELSLEYAGTLDFGKSEIGSTDLALVSKNAFDVTVSDLRGTGAGWTVTAMLGNFDDGSSSDSLPGASVVLGASPTITGSSTTDLPTSGGGTLVAGSGSAVTIFTAAEDNGLGEWNAEWVAGAATLNIPLAGAHIGTHTAVMELVLTDAP